MKYRNQSISDMIFMIIIYVFLWLVLISILYPWIYIISASFSDPSAVVAGKIWLLPVSPTLKAYKAVFNSNQLITGFTNSFFYTFFGTLISLFLTMIAAYPLSCKDLKGRNVFMFIFVFTMLFSGGLIPYYMVVKALGLINTRWALLIPGALSVYNVILARTYIQSNIPEELREAAEIDGCSDVRFFINILLPLSKPIIAVLAVMYAVGKWNSYFDALIFLSDTKLFPLQLILRNILVLNTPDPSMFSKMDVRDLMMRYNLAESLKYSTIVVSTLPILIFYPFVQKYFAKGIMIGSLKG